MPESQPAEEAVKQVLVRARRRSRFLVFGGGAAIAACVLGAISGIFPSGESFAPQFAQKPIEQTQPIKPVDASPSPLMVAINNPIIPIPKTDQASPKNSGDRSQLERKIENEVN